MKYISSGADLRLPLESLDFDTALRGQFLVPELSSRVSADPLVWPRPTEVSDLYASDLRSYPLGVPNDLRPALAVLEGRGATPVAFMLSEVAVAKLLREGWASHFEGARPEEELLEQGWYHAGFDVAELNGLCSALKGCGYKEPLWSKLRLRFGTSLNRLGLFHDPTIAYEFAGLRAEEIPEHAPFEVVGIVIGKTER